MNRPKIDYVPKGLYIDLEEAYSKYFQQVVTFFPEDKDDFLYMLRLLERWEKKSIPADVPPLCDRQALGGFWDM